MDALLATELPVIEYGILPTSTAARSSGSTPMFREVAVGVIAGLGVHGYALALQAMAELLEADREGASA